MTIPTLEKTLEINTVAWHHQIRHECIVCTLISNLGLVLGVENHQGSVSFGLWSLAQASLLGVHSLALPPDVLDGADLLAEDFCLF